MDEIHKAVAHLSDGGGHDTQPGERTAGLPPHFHETEEHPPEEETYDGLKRYDAEHEFHELEQVKKDVDAGLTAVTAPFADRLIFYYRVAAGLVVAAAGILPLLEFTGLPAMVHDYVRFVLGIALPVICLIYFLFWRYVSLVFSLRRAYYRLHVFIHSDVSNELKVVSAGGTGSLKSFGKDSDRALLRLLRLRIKGYHSWFRISIHAFLLSFRFRTPLETKLILSPRFMVLAAPTLTVLLFLAITFGAVQTELGASTDKTGYLDFALRYGKELWARATTNQYTDIMSGFKIPAVAVITFGFLVSLLCYFLVHRFRAYFLMRLAEFIDTSEFLTGFTHDCSKTILFQFKRRRIIIEGLMNRIPGLATGAAGSASLKAIFGLDEEVDEEDD